MITDAERMAIRQEALEDAANWVWEVLPGGSARSNISGHIRRKAYQERKVAEQKEN